MQDIKKILFLNITGYKFITLIADKLPQWRQEFQKKTFDCDLKGTILLSTEGINLSLSGRQEKIEAFLLFIKAFSGFEDLTFRKTWSDSQPFRRMLVRIKKEIISMGKPEVCPEKERAPYLDPQTFRSWIQENKDILILDTRNHYEVEIGTFTNAQDLNLKDFRDFPDLVQQLSISCKDKTIVTFCTGGIRCEKAALWMIKQGFHHVYQLQGGILNYFDQCGSHYFQGSCYVFDKRTAITSNSN